MAVNFMTQNQINSITQNLKMPQPCPDQLCGEYNNGNYSSVNRDDIDYNIITNIATYKNNGHPKKPIIAIVLESPHKNEYVNNIPIGPAKGTTGRLFDQYFQKLFLNSKYGQNFSNGSYDVVLLNAVQFQCSLGQPLTNINNKVSRDNNWLDIFNQYRGYNDTILRLKALRPQIVINLCTKGLLNLQLVLNNAISNQFSFYTYGTHPSTWNFSWACIN